MLMLERWYICKWLLVPQQLHQLCIAWPGLFTLCPIGTFSSLKTLLLQGGQEKRCQNTKMRIFVDVTWYAHYLGNGHLMNLCKISKFALTWSHWDQTKKQHLKVLNREVAKLTVLKLILSLADSLTIITRPSSKNASASSYNKKTDCTSQS